ncbi:flavodoxin domain-containing protein [Natronorubrum texcoconense]|uniref:Menaquinone-dependent protoporphyrinogen oxidase n=1 Tax=Natronorubrum texcoconense TaxID=1095776 RepID=A0A1G9ERF0_9EURY|nr:flavodoxin domain-containing protein [Natronorubrum texcoconense]SDK78585.1 menaquinone-dependent protoporphyrinogen oxidase [Natronorubrum texcoconense]
MTRVLVAYGSSEGQTATIAERVGDVLDSAGHEPVLIHLKHPPSGLDVAAYDGVIVGASIHAGSHQGYVAEFVRDHRETLNRKPSAFFSVSLTAANADPVEREPARELLEAFLEETGWEPDGTLTVAGALKYSEYGLVKRFVMRRIAGKASGDTDTSRDYEYTDWDEVEAFALEFSSQLS